MNSEHAKLILLACRPHGPDQADPEVAEALGLARQDPELGEWFRHHAAFQQTVQRSLRELPVPPALVHQILLQTRVVRHPAWWRNPRWLAVAAIIVLLLGLGALWWRPTSDGSFGTFRSRMVRAVLRQYSMDIVTNDMGTVRRFLDSRQAPADYTLPPALNQLPVAGAGVLSWADKRVSMVCLDSPDAGTLFLFVVDQAAIRSAPPAAPEFSQVSKLMTASWSQDGKAYVLATTGSPESLRRRFK